MMEFSEAVRLVEKALSNPADLTGMEAMNLSIASAILAREYINVRERIMPA